MKHDVVVPSAGESVNEVFIGQWRRKTGDIVKKDDVLVDIETQKASFELQAEQGGRLEVLKPDSETVVRPGDVIATIDGSVKTPSTTASAGATPSLSGPSGTAAPLSPAARKMVAEKGLNVSTLSGSGKGGLVIKEDVLGAEVDMSRGEKRQPASRVRRTIADNLVAAQHTAAILTTFNEADMSPVMVFRKKYKEAFQAKHGISLGIVGIFGRAVIRAIRSFPMVNATFTGDEIITRDFVDLSIAVSTDTGLVVPVIRDADRMTLAQFEKKLVELSEKAKARKLSIPEMSGGTFTISNGGVFGSLLSTPILNMSQSGILGLHKIQDRPVVVNGEITIRPMMYLALSYDHRLIDGREAVSFLVAIKEGIEKLELIVSEKDLELG